MPLSHRPDHKPVVSFDPALEVSPFALFRRLREGRAPRLVDARRPPGARTLAGAGPWPGDDWLPGADEEVVLIDDDGTIAVEESRRLLAAGCERVRALFGGMDLWEFALDPQVVGEETYLRGARSG